jgi:hypothetical protein
MIPQTSEPEAAAVARHRAPVPHRALLLVAVVVVLLTVGTVVAVVVHRGGTPSSNPSHPGRPGASGLRPSSAGGGTTFDTTARPAVRAGGPAPERPLTLALPDSVRVPVRPARTLSDGSLGVPHDITIAGWWNGGARVGDPYGAMVIAAHVDSTIQGLGPFASLLSAHRGDRLTVNGAHLSQRFSVARIALVKKTNRSAVAAQFSGLGRDRLVLITCAGPFIPAKGGYQNIAVITARPVALSPAR